MNIDKTIREGRRRNKLTQRELAGRLKVAPSAVAQWETGVTTPTIANRVDLARVLKIQFVDLVPEVNVGDEAIIKDPEILAVVRLLRALPPSVKTAVLMQLTALSEALGSHQTPENKPRG